jgi:hypothetical protein
MSPTCDSHPHPSVAFYRDSDTVIGLPVTTCCWLIWPLRRRS